MLLSTEDSIEGSYYTYGLLLSTEDSIEGNNNNNNKQAFKRRISNRKETQCAKQVDKSSKQMYTRCRETT